MIPASETMPGEGWRPEAPAQIRFGVDVTAENPGRVSEKLLSGKWGMVTNDAAQIAQLRTAQVPDDQSGFLSRKVLRDAGIPLVQLFSPEHGISGSGADGKAMEDEKDRVTGLPVCSLYGKRRCPPADLLKPLNGLLFDIPDIGSRFYTYIWTLSYVMEACEEAGIPLVILDRINPLGGDLPASEGPVLDTEFCSGFTGRAPVPVRHSLTAGEFAHWLKGQWKMELELIVVPVEGWKRSMHWSAVPLRFVPTSPAIPTYKSALCYPGICLFEATNISAGRGTVMPFRQTGAPWMNTGEVLSALQDADAVPALPGVTFHETVFTPDEDPWKGKSCRGIRLQIHDRHAFRPVRTGLTLLAVIRRLHPGRFAWKAYPTAANPTGEGHFERLIGATDIRPALENSPDAFLESLPQRLAVPDWQEKTKNFLLYD